MEFFLVNFRPTNYNLQPCVFLKFQKIPEIMCAVEFRFIEADSYMFSSE